MKVVKKGRQQKGWSKEFTCTGKGNGNGGCGAVLLVEQPDLYSTHHYDYGGGHDVFTTFQCCECGVETDITVPSQILHSIPNKKDHPLFAKKGLKDASN